MSFTWILDLMITSISLSSVVTRSPVEKTNWNAVAQEDLYKALRTEKNTNVAKNIILFIGDGMGVSTVTAARILKGQLRNQTGEESMLEFEKFPHVGMAKTYASNQQTPDSASTATALLCGEKTNAYLLGLNDNGRFNNCFTQYGNELKCITDWFREAGRSSGIVTTTRVTHATPAAGYAKSPNRNWESDFLHDGPSGCKKDIAYQLIFNNDLKVILGGGRMFFLRNTDADPEYGNATSSFQRKDGYNLIEEWKKKQFYLTRRGRYVWNSTQLNEIDPRTTDSLLGLFDASHMQYELDRLKTPQGDPSIAEMTEKAIQILQKDSNGYFLLVEGGRIDHGHHENVAKKALYDTLAFEDAIKKAVEMTNEKDTLVIVTADHSHVFNIAGYPSRGNDILGVSDSPADIPKDNVPYTTLLYANGPGYRPGPRQLKHIINSGGDNYKQVAAVPLQFETHAGEDVPIYAKGPMSHLIHGVHEQHYVAHVMAYAACVGANQDHCKPVAVNNGQYTQLIQLLLQSQNQQNRMNGRFH